MQREHRAERRNDEEGDPPTEQAVKRTSEQRRKARRSRHRNHGQRQSPRELLAVEQVTCDGARQDRGSASPKRLDDSAEDQEGQGVGEGTKDTAGDEDYKPPQHQPFAAEAVGKRSDQKLPDREGNEEAAQRQAEFLGRNAEAGSNPRKGRKDDVGGKCAERSQPSEQEQDSPCQTVLGRRGHHGFLRTIRHVDVPWAWSLPCGSSILPSSVMTVRPRETTWPMTRITPESMDIGRTNLAAVSCDGQVSPSERVVWAASAMAVSSIVMIQPPWTVFVRLQKRGSGVARSPTLPSSGGSKVKGDVSAIDGRRMLPSASFATSSSPAHPANSEIGAARLENPSSFERSLLGIAGRQPHQHALGGRLQELL